MDLSFPVTRARVSVEACTPVLVLLLAMRCSLQLDQQSCNTSPRSPTKELAFEQADHVTSLAVSVHSDPPCFVLFCFHWVYRHV